MSALAKLRALARYQTHGGYVWAAVTDDGAIICQRCASERDTYRNMYRATRDALRDGWQVVGLTNSGEMEQSETCANCNATIGSDHE